MRQIALIATVGGSPAPVRYAIETLRPTVVWFIVSSGFDGTRSSRDMVESPQINYAAFGEKEDFGPGLAHLDTTPVGWQIFEVPSDDPDATFALCSGHLRGLAAQYPDCRIVADYTGGTKSMTGGLLMAALGVEGVEVQFVVGQRGDLTQVASGTERLKTMSADMISTERTLTRVEALMQAYDYGAARLVAEELSQQLKQASGATTQLLERVRRTCRFTAILDHWDRFDFKTAAQLARESFESGGPVGEAVDQLGLLTSLQNLADQGKTQSTWHLCADLWLNAQRCAARGRFDDGVARLYRLTEAAMQAQLWEQYGIPNPVPEIKVPEDLARSKSIVSGDLNGIAYKGIGLGLEGSIRFLAHLNPVDSLYSSLQGGLSQRGTPSWTGSRNHSILAHGFNSLKREHWNTASKWITKHVRPMWFSIEPPQLPAALPKSLMS